MVALTVVLSLVVVVLAYALKKEISSNKVASAYNLEQAQKAEVFRKRLGAMLVAVEGCAGGVQKRISEHAEIVGVIRSEAPHLLEQKYGLNHWLSANDQFYKALRGALAQPTS